jgi:hypothetical protein
VAELRITIRVPDREATVRLSEEVARFYSGLRARGVPQEVAQEVSLAFVSALLATARDSRDDPPGSSEST